MSTPIPGTPIIPLTPELRAAYTDLNAQLEAAIEATADVTALQALNAQQAQVDDVLQKDAIYQLGANTDSFNALFAQINDTNNGLKALQTQIKTTASHFQTADSILSAISKVFGLFGIS